MRGFCSALRAAAGLCPHQTFVCAKGAVDFLLQGFWRPSGVTGAAGGDMVADCIPVRLSPKMHQGIDDLSQDRIDPGRPLRPFFFTRKLQDVRHGRGSSRASYPPKGLCRIMSSTWPPKMGAPFPGGADEWWLEWPEAGSRRASRNGVFGRLLQILLCKPSIFSDRSHRPHCCFL